jgi:ornithine cyclodeaminase/alanine dehydrogenase-like protein (mu-crystallin family)
VPLAVIESGSLTALRTGAATAVAAKFLARRDAHAVTLVGCGVQGETQLAALVEVLPIDRVRMADNVPARAEVLAKRVATRYGVVAKARADLRGALAESDVCVTCTPSRRAFIAHGDIPPGMFIAAIGADSHGKQELDPSLLASATLVVDVLDQCAEIGELQHALAAGLMTREHVHAELAEVVVGRRPGRTWCDEITVFDSTGTALEDVAAAVAVYDKARAAGRGIEIPIDA